MQHQLKQAAATLVLRPPPLPPPLPAGARRRQAVAALARRHRSGGAPPLEDQRTVTFRVPGQEPRRFISLTQAGLDEYLRLKGAEGFDAGGGNVSRLLADLPDGGTVDLVLPAELPLEMQVRNLQRADANDLRGKEQQLSAFLQDVARAEHGGSTIAVLPTDPLKRPNRQDYVQLDAGVIAGNMLYLGEHKCVPGDQSLDGLETKLTRIRAALTRGTSSDLAAALQGVTHAKLFLAGEVVQAGLAVEDLVNKAARAGMSVVLPSGQALGMVGAAPKVRL